MTQPERAPDEIAEIIAGLTKVMRLALTERAELGRTWDGQEWFTYQRPNTHEALGIRGLIYPNGLLTENGLAVRQHLMEQPR